MLSIIPNIEINLESTKTNSINHCNRFSGRDVAEPAASALASAMSLQNLSVSLFFQVGIKQLLQCFKSLKYSSLISHKHSCNDHFLVRDGKRVEHKA